MDNSRPTTSGNAKSSNDSKSTPTTPTTTTTATTTTVTATAKSTSTVATSATTNAATETIFLAQRQLDGESEDQSQNNTAHSDPNQHNEEQILSNVPSTLQLRLYRKERERRVTWTEETVDNEHMNKNKSKCCCIYRKAWEFGESSSSDEGDGRHCSDYPKKRRKIIDNNQQNQIETNNKTNENNARSNQSNDVKSSERIELTDAVNAGNDTVNRLAKTSKRLKKTKVLWSENTKSNDGKMIKTANEKQNSNAQLLTIKENDLQEERAVPKNQNQKQNLNKQNAETTANNEQNNDEMLSTNTENAQNEDEHYSQKEN